MWSCLPNMTVLRATLEGRDSAQEYPRQPYPPTSPQPYFTRTVFTSNARKYSCT